MGINPKTFCISSTYFTSESYPRWYTLQKLKKWTELGKYINQQSCSMLMNHF